MLVIITGGLPSAGLGGGVGSESLTIGAENSAVQISDVTVYQVDAGTDFRKKVSRHIKISKLLLLVGSSNYENFPQLQDF